MVPPNAPSRAAQDEVTVTAAALSLKDRVEQLERQILCETLEQCGWNKSRAAQMLDLSRIGFNKKLERYRLKQTAG
jgi:two-component system response regulator HupR/HoxA